MDSTAKRVNVQPHLLGITVLGTDQRFSYLAINGFTVGNRQKKGRSQTYPVNAAV